MKILIQDEHGVRELEEGYATEEELQTFLRDHAELFPVDEIELGTPPLLCIGWEVNVASGSEDLLYVDETGLLTIVETKLRRNPEARRAVVGQILEYASYAALWTDQELEVRAHKFLCSEQCPAPYRGLTLEEAVRTFLDSTNSPAKEHFSYRELLDSVKSSLQLGRIRLVIAVDEPPPSLLRTVEFVNQYSQHFEMYLFQLRRFRDMATGQNIFVPALFGKVATTASRSREEWTFEKYITKLGWSQKEADAVQNLVSRLESVSADWDPQTRFNQGWVSVYCFGQHVFGAQSSKKHGAELWFRLKQNPEEGFPQGAHPRQMKSYLYVSGKPESLDDHQLRRLCEATLREVGLGPFSHV